jgi:hypothetical protein
VTGNFQSLNNVVHHVKGLFFSQLGNWLFYLDLPNRFDIATTTLHDGMLKVVESGYQAGA